MCMYGIKHISHFLNVYFSGFLLVRISSKRGKIPTLSNIRVCFLLQRVLRNRVPVRTWVSSRWQTWIGINGIRARVAEANISKGPYPSVTTVKKCDTLKKGTRIGGAASWITRWRRDGPTTSIWSMKEWVDGRVRIAAIGVTKTTAWRKSPPHQKDHPSWRIPSEICKSVPCARRSEGQATTRSNVSRRACAPRREDHALSVASRNTFRKRLNMRRLATKEKLRTR